MVNKYNNSTTIRLDPEIKGWLYTRCNNENRSLGNLINTILKKEKESDDTKLDTDRLRIALKKLGSDMK
jgi:hypothetical protein